MKTFKMHFLEWKLLYFDETFIEICSPGPINNIPALVQIMAWRLSGAKPLSEPMIAYFNDAYIRHIRQWVKAIKSALYTSGSHWP